MKIHSKASFANTLLLLMALLAMLFGQFSATSNQINWQNNQVAEQLTLLLSDQIKLDTTDRINAISQIPGILTLEVIDVSGTQAKKELYPRRFTPPLSFLKQYISESEQPLVATGSGLKVTLTSDLSFVHLQFFQNCLILLAVWLVLVFAGLFWLRGMIQSPIHRSISDLQSAFKALLERKESLPENNQLVKEFAEIENGLKQIQVEIVERLNSTEKELSVVRQAAYLDHLTGLPNRNQFLVDMQAVLSNELDQHFGILTILRSSSLGEINRDKGYVEGDKYINSIAGILNELQARYRKSDIYRLNSSDFAIVSKSTTPREAQDMADAIKRHLNELQQALDLNSIAFLGLSGYESGMELSELLAVCDSAASIAQTREPNGWHFQANKKDGATQGEQCWRETIQTILDKDAVVLFKQALLPLRQKRAYTEIMARFQNQDEVALPTDSLIAMAERLGLAPEIDRLVIRHVLEAAAKLNVLAGDIGINLSANSAHDPQFNVWLERLLLKNAKLAARLTFELPELGLQRDTRGTRRFIDMLHRCGAKISVENFGLGLASFRFFKDLKPDFIKIDPSFMADLEHDKNTQYFIRQIIDLAHRMSVKVVAEGVESAEQKQQLETMYVDAVQGYQISKPVPINEPVKFTSKAVL